MKKIVSTMNAPQAIGPYSQAVISGDLIFLSGQIPLDPETGRLWGSEIAAQTERVLKNIQAVIEAAGGSLSDILKTTVYLVDLKNFNEMNRVYERYFQENPPARATIQVASLPAGAMIEIEAVARMGGNG